MNFVLFAWLMMWCTVEAFVRGSVASRRHMGLVSRALPVRRDESLVTAAPSDKVIAAVEVAPNRRLSAQDAAALSGTDLATARTQLMLLASLTEGVLEVTNDGEVIYSFSPDFKSVLLRRSPAAKLRSVWRVIAPPLMYGTRVAFALMLFTSLAVIGSAVVVAFGGGGGSSKTKSESRDDEQSSSGRLSFNTNLSSDRTLFDLIAYSPEPNYSSSRAVERGTSPSSVLGEYLQDNSDERWIVNPIEALFSFVFGDGDPNDRLADAQWLASAAVIRKNGGVIISEQLAPFFGVTATNGEVVNESWVLPVVLKFGGEPFVTENGNIGYKFTDLATSALAAASKPADAQGGVIQPPAKLVEQPLPFSRAVGGSLAIAGLLGVVNVVGTIWLGGMLRSPVFLSQVGYAMPFLSRLYPALAAYASLYAGLPIFRAITASRKNAEVERRNKERDVWVSKLGSPEVRDKLEDVRAHSRKQGWLGRSIANDQIFYSSGTNK